MSPLRFRAWIPNEKHMFYQHDQYLGSFIRRVCTMLTAGPAHESYVADGIEQYLMQSTGLHDKNGKEIFEGDVLNYTRPEGSPYRILAEWKEHYDQEDGEHTGFDFGTEYVSDMEIIGNIYENPELLPA